MAEQDEQQEENADPLPEDPEDPYGDGLDQVHAEEIVPLMTDGVDDPTPEQRRAVLKLHQNTGHRHPLRLARALAMCGAEKTLIKAAKELRCEVCHERPPSVGTRLPASLPAPRQAGQHLFSDLFSIKDVKDTTFWVAHIVIMVDSATRYSVARVLEAKTTAEVIKFFNESWFSVFGAPVKVTTDMGPEYISEAFQNLMERRNVVLEHVEWSSLGPMDWPNEQVAN